MNLSNLFIPMLFSTLTLSNFITLFVHHYCELVQSVYSNVVFQLSLSLITSPHLYIITIDLSNLFIPMLFFQFLILITLPYLYIITLELSVALPYLYIISRKLSEVLILELFSTLF